MARVAVVTGSNKGIGTAIVRGLCKQLDQGIVYLTSRDARAGNEAVAELKKQLQPNEASKLRYHQLDICDRGSVEALRDDLKKEHGGLDILVNNAGIAYKGDSTAPFSEQAEVTTNTNYFGTRCACEVLLPILRPHARVVNLCTRLAILDKNYSDQVKAKLLSEDLTIDQLDAMAKDFIACAKAGTHQKKGYPNSSYAMSKALEISLTLIQDRQMSKDARQDIIVNACCPGLVQTDMSSHRGHLTVDQGAETPIWLSLLAADDPKAPRGKLCYEGKAHDWIDATPLVW